MKPVECTFHGGPVHGIVFAMTRIPEYQFLLDPREKTVAAYHRDELEYFFDEHVSAAASARYDEVKEKLTGNDMDPLRDA